MTMLTQKLVCLNCCFLFQLVDLEFFKRVIIIDESIEL